MTPKTPLALDHITVVARTLEEGTAHINSMLGIDMPTGGAHPAMGTHNCLLSLGDQIFLELIAIDPKALAPDRPRWFDLDRFNAAPVLGTWVLGTPDLATTLRTAHQDSGVATEITRGNLSWLISVSEDGRMPLGGAFPALIEWPEGPHPALGMADLGCRLISLDISHPEAETIETLIGSEIDQSVISINKGPMRISASISTPNGIRTLC